MRPLTVFVVEPINPRKPLRAGEVLPVSLEQTISGFSGHHEKGPHPVGRAETLPNGKLRISITDTNAGRHAIAMLADDLLDTVHWKGTARLRVIDGGR